MMDIGRMTQVDGQYEYRDASRSLVVRGPHPEWVLQAAGEVIGTFSRLERQSQVEELAVMCDLGAADQAELAAASGEFRQRFECSPRCQITLGCVDYFWASHEGPQLKPDEIVAKPLTLGPHLLVVPRAG